MMSKKISAQRSKRFVFFSLVITLVLAVTILYAFPGGPDPSFGSTGYVVTNPFSEKAQSSFASDLEIQTDGKLIVAGNRVISESVQEGVVIRYNANGSLDSTFAGSTSGGGIATVSVPGVATQELSATAIQANNKILVTGSFENQGDFGLFIGRFNENGSLDLNFGGSGNGYRQLGVLSGGGLATDILVQPNGKILVAGGYPDVLNQTLDFGVYRFEANGNLDLTFGTFGRARIPIGTGIDVALSIALQPDGRIVAAGVTGVTETGGGDAAFVRLNQNGSLDNSFGTGGKAVLPLSEFTDAAMEVVIQPDSKIVASGIACSNAGCATSAGFALRLMPNGSPDLSFNGSGQRLLSIPGSDVTSLASLALKSDGAIVLAGTASTASAGTDALIVRLLSNGDLDTTFGDSGVVLSDIGGSDQQANAVKIQADSKAVAAGSSRTDQRLDIAVWRYLDSSLPPTGSNYMDFDGDGKTDVSIFRPTGGSGAEWWYLRSSDGGNGAYSFGASTDTPVPADFTGDGKTDVAFWRPSTGQWFILRSEDSTFYAFPFGSDGDIPMPADFDGDGEADATVFRPSTNTWFTRRSSDGQVTFTQFGTAGDLPVAADYDGDGKADIAIYRRNGGSGAEWWYLRSSDGGNRGFAVGSATDKAVPADYTGDGKADIAFWRPSTGEWYILRSEDNSFYAFPFGVSTDIPVPGDYDGDGKADAAVFRPSNNTWYLQRSTAGFQAVGFGATGDRPLPNVFIR